MHRIAVLSCLIALASLASGCKISKGIAKSTVPMTAPSSTPMTAPIGKHTIAVYDEGGRVMVKYLVDANDQFGLPKSAKLVHPEGGDK
jgi:hypothetical protein